MEFQFSVNLLLQDEITVVDHRVEPSGFRKGNLMYKEQLRDVIDTAGKLSAKAQGLKQAITTAAKLETSNHSVYIMKDSKTNSGQGSVIGFIKMGRKKLFVLDSNSKQLEVTPNCVLDFYVHESRQRQGLGRKLFQHMLQAEGVRKIEHVAIDKPSVKFQNFLRKHYNLSRYIPQVNNFAVFEGFFHNRNDTVKSEQAARDVGLYKAKQKHTWLYEVEEGHFPGTRATSSSYSRPLAHFVREKEALKTFRVDSSQSFDAPRIQSPDVDAPATRSHQRRFSAQAAKYSRHSLPNQSPTPSTNSSSNRNLNGQHHNNRKHDNCNHDNSYHNNHNDDNSHVNGRTGHGESIFPRSPQYSPSLKTTNLDQQTFDIFGLPTKKYQNRYF